MTYDFTEMPDCRGRDSIAVDLREPVSWAFPQGETRPGFDRIPMWIADMSFPTAPCVTEAIARRLSHPVFGYFMPSDEYYGAIQRWHADSFGTADLTRRNIGYENGVLGGVTSALRVLDPEKSPVLVHSPTYTGFTFLLEQNGYPVALSPLRPDENGVPRMDYADMEEKIKAHGIRTALLCSPHNPSGRVWERWELERAMELFRRCDVRVISDEIWADLTLFGRRHIPTQSVSDYARQNTIAFYAPTKTFNLAGLVGSYHITCNEALGKALRRCEAQCHYNDMNVLSMHALIGAYTPEGREWLGQLRQVLEANIDLAADFFRSEVQGVSLYKPEGTYMIVPDFTEWCAVHGRSFDDLLRGGTEVGVLWRDGRQFHIPHGIRMALALPTAKLEEALGRLKKYVL